jgi:threonine aldolase
MDTSSYSKQAARRDATLDLAQVEAAIRPDDDHSPRTRLICLENTHNRCGGACLTPEYMGQVRALADRYGLKIHLDGARVFNAAVALGVDVRKLTRDADSVSFCLCRKASRRRWARWCVGRRISSTKHVGLARC